MNDIELTYGIDTYSEQYLELFGASYFPTNQVLVYCSNSKSIKAIQGLAYPRNNCSAVLFDNKLYVIGGSGVRAIETLDFKHNIWHTLPCELFEPVVSPLLLNIEDRYIVIFDTRGDKKERNYIKNIYYQVYNAVEESITEGSVKVFDDEEIEFNIYNITGAALEPSSLDEIIIFANFFGVLNNAYNGKLLLKFQETQENLNTKLTLTMFKKEDFETVNIFSTSDFNNNTTNFLRKNTGKRIPSNNHFHPYVNNNYFDYDDGYFYYTVDRLKKSILLNKIKKI
jgi:hypothetical protein